MSTKYTAEGLEMQPCKRGNDECPKGCCSPPRPVTPLNRTPGPYAVYPTQHAGEVYITDSAGDSVARVHGDPKHGTAAFIVRACNNHEALLAALIQIRDMDYVPQFAERVAEIARAAIEACEVQS